MNMQESKKRWFEHLKQEAIAMLSNNQEVISSFRQHCNLLGIEITEKNIRYEHGVGILVSYENILTALCPHLIIDKDVLFDFKQLSNEFIRPTFFGSSGLFHAHNFVLMASPLFRRGMNPSNNWHPHFIEEFWNLNLPESSVKIALDTDQVQINMNEYGKVELDTWYGARFQRDLSAIKDGLVEIRPPAYLDDFDLEFFFGSAYSLHIKWSTEQNIRTFQAESFLQPKILIEYEGDIWHPVHYVHAEWDISKNVFRHFDGAIHFYQPNDYMISRDQDLNYNLKNANQIKAKSKKLFRVDDNVDLETWMKLTSHFFPKNPLIIEYFEGDYPQHIKEVLENILDGADGST